MSDESTEDPNSTSKWGHGKTDPDTWWKKGCASPNPKGRPKGAKNNRTIYRQAFQAKVRVKVDGKWVWLTKDELSYVNFANRCSSGDPKALALKLQFDEKFAEPEPVEPTKEQTASNLKLLDHYIALRQKFGAAGSDTSDE
jgi:hypothetical protein